MKSGMNGSDGTLFTSPNLDGTPYAVHLTCSWHHWVNAKIWALSKFEAALTTSFNPTPGNCQGLFVAAMFWPLFWVLFQRPWWSRFVGIRGAPKLTEACPRHEDKARLRKTRIEIILLLGSLSNNWWCSSGTLWCLLDLQKYCIGLGLQEVVLPSCIEKLMVKQVSTLIHLRHAKTFLCESLVRGCTVYWTNYLEPTWTSLNLSWKMYA